MSQAQPVSKFDVRCQYERRVIGTLKIVDEGQPVTAARFVKGYRPATTAYVFRDDDVINKLFDSCGSISKYLVVYFLQM